MHVASIDLELVKSFFEVSFCLLILYVFLLQELEAATLILQRHIDLELQISKCLENLKAVQR